MAMRDKTRQIDEILSTMSTIELADILDRVAEHRSLRPCGFLELPPELRNIIYRMCIDPRILEDHIRHRSSPSLLRVNRQIGEEFRSLYYTPENITVELYRGPDLGWKEVTDLKVLQAIVGGWSWCGLGAYRRSHFDLDAISIAKPKMERWYNERSESGLEFLKSHRDEHLTGVLKFPGLPTGMAVLCHYYIKAEKDERKRKKREKAARLEKWIVED